MRIKFRIAAVFSLALLIGARRRAGRRRRAVARA